MRVLWPSLRLAGGEIPGWPSSLRPNKPCGGDGSRVREREITRLPSVPRVLGFSVRVSSGFPRTETPPDFGFLAKLRGLLARGVKPLPDPCQVSAEAERGFAHASRCRRERGRCRSASGHGPSGPTGVLAPSRPCPLLHLVFGRCVPHVFVEHIKEMLSRVFSTRDPSETTAWVNGLGQVRSCI